MAFKEVDAGPMPEGKFVQFGAIGDKFLGLFERTQETTANYSTGPKQVTEYLFRNKEGIHQLTPGYDLKRKLEAAQLQKGHAVRITFTGVAPSQDPSKSGMKLFKLEVDADYKPAGAPPPPPPQNDDIPF